VIFFLIIGAYWLLRTQKDAVFNTIVGIEHQPKAKIASLLIIIPILLIYSKLVDVLTKNTLLISFSTAYAIGFAIIASFLQHPTIGLPNTNGDFGRVFGWFVYVFIETFGSIMPGLFWAFVNSTTSSDSAKKGYPLIIAGAQVGSILGSTASFKTAYFGGNAILFNYGGLAIFAIIPAVLFYLWAVPTPPEVEVKGAKKPQTGMFEGLWILFTRPYVLGIFALATLYEIIATILDFQMKLLAKPLFPTSAEFASFQGFFGIITNVLALVFALTGTRFLIERFGLRFCLMLFPVATAGVVGFVYFNHIVPLASSAEFGLYVVTGSVIIIKALSYALNNPAKEIMYIPTTKDVKTKAKSWIDMFGSRSSKGVGSSANWILQTFSNDVFLFGTLFSLGVAGVWFLAATYVGTKFDSLTKKNEVIS